MSVRLELVVLSYNGQALAAPLCRALDAPVSVGRGSDNDLPLNDPERLISRHQARLSMGLGGAVDISNLSSSSSLFINGNELAPGRTCTLSPSDQLLIGRYVLGLRAATLAPAPFAAPVQATAAIPDDPLFGPMSPVSTPAAAASAQAMPAAMPKPPAAQTIPPPLAQPVAQAAARPAPARPVPVPPAMPMATKPKPVQQIPDDFDVFSPPAPPPLASFSMPAGEVTIEDSSEKARVNEVFAELQVLQPDVLGESPEDARQRNRMLDVENRNKIDPMQLFDAGIDMGGASVSLDHGLEIDSLFVVPSLVGGSAAPAPAPAMPPIQGIPPAASFPANAQTMQTMAPVQPMPSAAPAALSSAAAAEQMMADLLGSGPALDPATAITTFDNLPILEAPPAALDLAPPPHYPQVQPAAAAPRPAPAAPPAAAPARPLPAAAAPAAARPIPPSAARPASAPVPANVAAVPAAAAAPVAANAAALDADAAAILRAAFARGCGVDVNCIADFTPQALEVLGRIVAAMTSGTIRLMHGRSSTKHEMRANVTIIATDGNNPLKFAPDGAAALTQLLGRGSPGFMPPLRAIDDAFDDLSAHQVGLLAGSRAAMYDVAQMLGPDRFLARAGEKSGLETMMPAKHKARLWDLYESGYQEMVGEAREEFENLFQRAFARAYEQEIDRINTGKSR
ncbi:FHA domain protein [Tahibacter aquaticus]|uniref:FHA domain protein n=1 Tax=Tahibacter aquaticus TaxID=520092 RepID=A0A4R6Z7Z4_9GAMM|nr:type VI secretion system-associated FHA domain protein TagH [Tahibacter aquaticus]TDR47864.1 FHA domain protein [Tahibacter aquaticus]